MGEDLKEAKAWCKHNGWAGVWSAALPGQGKGTMVGVCLFAPSNIGIAVPSHISVGELSAGRAVAAHVAAGPPGGVGLASVYLHTGQGLSADNKAVLATVAEHVVSWQGRGLLRAIGKCPPSS